MHRTFRSKSHCAFVDLFSNTFNRHLTIKLRMPKDDPLRNNLRTPKGLVDLKKYCMNLPDPVQMTFVKETDTDFSELFSKLKANTKDDMDEEN